VAFTGQKGMYKKYLAHTTGMVYTDGVKTEEQRCRQWDWTSWQQSMQGYVKPSASNSFSAIKKQGYSIYVTHASNLQVYWLQCLIEPSHSFVEVFIVYTQ